MEITGRIVHAMETRSGVSARTGKQWSSKDYVLEIPNGQYSPRHFVFTVFGDEKIKSFALRKDEDVTVYFDIDANEYQGKWYNRFTAYNITRLGEANSQQVQVGAYYAPPQQAPVQPQPMTTPVPQQGQDDNVLPF